MCGIAGIVGGHPDQRRDAVDRMVRALRHRGPDANGILEFGDATLGHTRLAIVDLSGGTQPMPSAADSRVAVTFNGEIYGFRDLRTQYNAYPFRSTSDTELLLAMYHAHGGSFIEKLPGMFAFGLWDDSQQSLLLARDRFGEKPLYWAPLESTTGIIFASELKAILASGLIKPRLNRDALAHYLQYLYVHPTQTIYENIHTLPPAHRLTWRAGRIESAAYWSLPEPQDMSHDDAVEKLRHLFTESVRKQLVADVPVGAFLSGGLDSSTVVAVAAQQTANLNTFSFRFRGATGDADEGHHALAVAQRYGTRHHILEDSDADIAALLVDMARVYDEPFADSSNIATWLIARQARQHLKVVLTGDGGDELLAGYPWYRDLYNRPPASTDSIADARLKQNRFFSDATIHKFGLAPSRAPKRIAGTNALDDALRMDLLDYMPGDILVKIDRAAMAHGLELRAPFLDFDLATFLIALPHPHKINATTDKLIFRDAFADLWPESVRTRGKQGFGAPITEWLARPQVQKMVHDRLRDPQHPLFALLPFDATRIAVDRQNFQTWSLLVLALWLEQHPF